MCDEKSGTAPTVPGIPPVFSSNFYSKQIKQIFHLSNMNIRLHVVYLQHGRRVGIAITNVQKVPALLIPCVVCW